MNKKEIKDFYKGKKIFITGHTGFKGSWLSIMLSNAGAKVIGYSTCSKSDTRLFDICGIKDEIIHIKGDVRNLESLVSAISQYEPEIVFHLAAQPIVRQSYKDPVGTYSTNVMGTVNICEAIRRTPSVRSFLNVTTDKVYDNKEWIWGYRENESLDGFDPYSNSKSCSELVTHSYKRCFLASNGVAVSTARAGNVIGGGDFANDRIIPDCIKATIKGESIIIRNPYSIRPYQHVLEPLYAYLMIAAMQYGNTSYQSWYNIGPDDNDCFQTRELVEIFVKKWGEGANWRIATENGPHEANCLKLDNSRIKQNLGWKPTWNLETAVERVVEWSKAWRAGENVRVVMNKQIEEFLEAEL